MQMKTLAELFNRTTLAVPVLGDSAPEGTTALTGRNLRIALLSIPRGTSWRRKILFPFWVAANLPRMFRLAWNADAVHAPIPGDVGTIGMLLALVLRKPLFVRHCGNWHAPRTLAERFWKRLMERYAGGRNVMLATGGSPSPPSARNPNIHWIFATTLTDSDLCGQMPKTSPPSASAPRLMIACRQEPRKGTDKVLQALPLLLVHYPQLQLHVIGNGSSLPALKADVERLNVQHNVVFHGRLPHTEVQKMMSSADLFCYPTSASEGFPKVALEALASGLPVVATPVSALAELVDQDCGVLLEDDAPTTIARAVQHCMSDGDRYVRMSQAATVRARQYSLEAWRDQIGQRLQAAWGPLSRNG